MKFFRDLFDDDNHINEKAVIGFIAFTLLCIAFITDLVTSILNHPITINRTVFDGFMLLVLGSFGIASVDKWINRKNSSSANSNTDIPAE